MVNVRLACRAAALPVPAVPAILGLITGGYHAAVPPLWRDEAATKAIAGRSVGQILATMPHDDVVHGAYYLVVHVAIRLFGSSNGALRLPSVIAMAVACAFTALIGQQLCRGPWLSTSGRLPAACAGMTAGLVFALLPAAIRYAQEARSYAIVTMLATVATYLLTRAASDGGGWWWASYAVAVCLTSLFNVFGLLLLAAHGLALVAAAERGPGRRPLATAVRWLAAGGLATAPVLPVAIMAYGQRAALNWMSSSVPVRRDVVALTRLWAGSPGLVWPVFGLAAFGAVASLIAGRRDLSPATVALPWLVVPPAVLLAVSTARPVYDQRYIEFCLPALAICVGTGITWLWLLAATALGAGARARTRAGRSGLGSLAPLPAAAAAAALVIALQPADSAVRQPGDRPDSLELAARIVASNARPGDIVFYLPMNDRIVSLPFPGPWRRLRDIALAASPTASDTLYGTDVSPAEVLRRYTRVTRVWVVSSFEIDYRRQARATPVDGEEVALIGVLREIRSWRDGDTELTLYAAR